MSTSSFFKKIFAFGLAIAVLLAPSVTHAAEFRSGERLSVSTRTENLYAAGSTVDIAAPVDKDLIAAGRIVRIGTGVERNIIAAGETIEINSSFVGASVRAAGRTITLQGTFNEDVVVAAETINLVNAQINGDLVATAQTITLENTAVDGKAIVSYESVVGDLENAVAGEITTYEITPEASAQEERSIVDRIFLPWEFSAIVAIIIVGILLNSRGRLDIPSVRLDKQFLIDIMIGLAVFATIPVALFLSFFIILAPLLLPLAVVLVMASILAMMVLPIYVANLAKHSFQLTADIRILIAISYLTLLLLSIIPGLGIFWILFAVIYIGMIGFLTRADLRALKHYLEPRHPRKHKK